MTFGVDCIRDAIESGVPSTIATCAADGTPNVTFVSQVEYVDPQHVALTFQFFNKTRENILANPLARVYVTDSGTGASYWLTLRYLRTEFEGPLFERMKARLAGIASQTGMSGIFRLKGSDIYQVLHIDTIPGIVLQPPPPRRNLLAALRDASCRIAACDSFDSLLDETLLRLQQCFDIHHAMLLMLDECKNRLYTVASCGYDESGIGSEIALGDGVIGVAAEQRTPIRISHMTSEYAYSRAVRRTVQQGGFDDLLQTEIPFPGLAEAHSQLAVPILGGTRLLGVLYVESPVPDRFCHADEDAILTLAAQLSSAIQRQQDAVQQDEESAAVEGPLPTAACGSAVNIRHYAENDSVFIGEDYLIKGVAGAVIWRMLAEFAGDGRTEFTNRELRLDPALRLPDFSDNLEARLTLLNRRLAERCNFLRLHKTGRGRYRLEVQRPVKLVEIAKTALA